MLSPGEIEDPQITSEQLLSLKSDIRIINMLEELANKHCPSQFQDIETGGKISKSNDKALAFRDEGKKMLRQKNFMKALLAFTQSVANAEDKTEMLGLAYGGRAEVLFEKGYFNECLQDIERALQNNYPKDLERGLLEKKAHAESNRSTQPSKPYHGESPKLPHVNPKIPCASGSVEIQRDSFGGRHVVATTNIEAGDIIAVERPYVVAIGTKPSQRFLHCHECLEMCYNLIPCPGCRTALYCSEECRDVAKEWYHSSECDLCQFDFNELLSVKTVLKGLKQLTTAGSNGQQFDGTVYKSDRYEEIQELQTNKEKRSVRDLFEAANEACIVHHFLVKYTDFFSKTEISEERLKELLFHHYFNTTINKISVEKTKKNSVDTEYHEVAEAVYAFSGLLNHHCYGNVTASFYGSAIVLRAARNIKSGESCCLTYRNYNFAEYPKLVRSHQLWKFFQFTCTCEACENNWPIFDCLNSGDIDKYKKLEEQVKSALTQSISDVSAILKVVTKKVKEFSAAAEPTKVDVNVKRIFCDLLKVSGKYVNVSVDFFKGGLQNLVMPEYTFELERSAYYQNRVKLLKLHTSPKISDAKANLGDALSKVVFDECEVALREDFGLKEPLRGPGDMLWVSPSDLLLGKIALKPPFTPKCLQALTHKGILEIGQGLEDKFRQDMELDKQKALEKYKQDLLATIEDRMKSEIKDIEIRERLACHIEMEKQQQEFEVTLIEELDKLEKKIREQYERIIATHETHLKEKWEQKLLNEVKKTADVMTKTYLNQLDEQEHRLSEMFKLELKKQELLREFDAQLYKHKTNEALRQLKHNLECTNLVNMMYVLCTERHKCCIQKQEIEKCYKEEIAALEGKLKHKEQVLQRVIEEKNKQITEVSIRETCLREVIKHFQKFINFALKAAPTQAEFLLSVEKMMVFELTSQVEQTELPGLEVPPLIPWMHDGRSNPQSQRTSTLEVKDHHDCFRELNPPVKENNVELGVDVDDDDILPAIYFKDKTYIREDFRDMLTGGVPLSPSNELWNKDVEILVANWRQQEYRENEELFDEESVFIGEAEVLKSPADKLDEEMAQSDRRRSNKSTVQFIENDSGGKSSLRMSLDSRKLSRKTSALKHTGFPYPEEIHFQPVKQNSTLLAARDSLDLLQEKRRKSMSMEAVIGPSQEKPRTEDSNIKEAEPSKELVVETRDSVILRKIEMVKGRSSGEFSVSLKDSIEITKHALEEKIGDIDQHSSKLLSAKNSLELLRESIQKLKNPSLICQKKDSKKQMEKEDKERSHSFMETCCLRCKRKDDFPESDLTRPTGSIPDGDERSVKISRIQIINLDDHVPTPSEVSFDHQPMFYRQSTSSSVQQLPVEAKSTMTTAASRKNKKSKRAAKQKTKSEEFNCKVLGDVESKEGDQPTDEFTADRIHSLVKLMSSQPHLIQLFTSGIR